jgi:hypothetical protein
VQWCNVEKKASYISHSTLAATADCAGDGCQLNCQLLYNKAEHLSATALQLHLLLQLPFLPAHSSSRSSNS